MNLNVRDFPEELKGRLKSKAALTGKSLRWLVIALLDGGLEQQEAKKTPTTPLTPDQQRLIKALEK